MQNSVCVVHTQQEVIRESQISCFALQSWRDDRVLLIKDGDTVRGHRERAVAVLCKKYTFFFTENQYTVVHVDEVVLILLCNSKEHAATCYTSDVP